MQLRPSRDKAKPSFPDPPCREPGSRILRFWEKIAPHFNSVNLTHNQFAELDHFRAEVRRLADRMAVDVSVTMRPCTADILTTNARAPDRPAARLALTGKGGP